MLVCFLIDNVHFVIFQAFVWFLVQNFLFVQYSWPFFGFKILIFSWLLELLEKVLAFSLILDLVFPHQALAEEIVFCVFNKRSKLFLEIVIFPWVVEFLESILAFSLKQYLVYFHQSLAAKWLFFVFLIKKKKSLQLRRTRAYIKENYFQESFPWIFSNFSFWGECVNRSSIIMISKGYHYVINVGIVSNFFIIGHVYPGSLPKDLS